MTATHTKTYDFHAEIHRKSDGVGFGRREVPRSILEGPREQVRFAAQRSGLLGPDQADADVCETPQFRDDRTDQIKGLTLSIGKGKRCVQQTFDLRVFETFASTVTADLLKNELLALDDRVGYRVFARPSGNGTSVSEVKTRVLCQPLVWRDGQLDEWIAAGQPNGPVNDTDHGIFILQETLDHAHELSWKGRDLEGGCWLLGSLYRQRKPYHDVFVVIHSAIEAHGVNHTQFGLELTADTYHQLQLQLERRQNVLGLADEEPMAFQHTHPFLPSDLEKSGGCVGCEKRHECHLSSAFLSTHDARFHNAVFGRSPYAVQIVVGLTPREEFDLRMYCFDGGRFRERGYYTVDVPPVPPV